MVVQYLRTHAERCPAPVVLVTNATRFAQRSIEAILARSSSRLSLRKSSNFTISPIMIELLPRFELLTNAFSRVRALLIQAQTSRHSFAENSAHGTSPVSGHISPKRQLNVEVIGCGRHTRAPRYPSRASQPGGSLLGQFLMMTEPSRRGAT